MSSINYHFIYSISRVPLETRIRRAADENGLAKIPMLNSRDVSFIQMSPICLF